ncbi:MAG: muramoyltetrapeptide carboxypeptidase [Sphingomonadales bacterium]|nr:muramoyltetrapeptide carboxypeptidase [Sphingomonadales bacterium]
MLNRRTMIQTAAAALLVPSAGIAAPLPARRKPARLRRGDTVGLVEPAYFTPDAFDLDLVLETIRAMGLVPKPAPNILSRYGYLAGRDEERAAQVNAMFADREVRAIFAVRGGWGSARILPHLDFNLIRANPKLLIGFSDITALHLALAARTDCPSIHGPNAASAWGRLSWDSFRRLVFDAETPTWETPAGTDDRLAQRSGRVRTFRPGRASGPLIGGNLTVLSSLVGTPYLPSFDGALLFLEDTDEAQYRIDRMLTQLALAGILGRVAGVVFGQCTDCIARNSSSIGGFTLSEVLDQHLAPLGVPAFQGALFGHVENQFSLPVGVRAEIDAAAGTIRMLEPVVA